MIKKSFKRLIFGTGLFIFGGIIAASSKIDIQGFELVPIGVGFYFMVFGYLNDD